MATAVGLLAGALLLPAVLRAEDGSKGKPGAYEKKGGKEGFKERVREKFGISEEQAAKLKAARRAKRDGIAAAHADSAAAMRKLKDQLEDKASDKELSATLGKLAEARKKMRAEKDKFEAALSSILTPTQRAKMAMKMKGRMGKMHGAKGYGGKSCGAKGCAGKGCGGKSY